MRKKERKAKIIRFAYPSVSSVQTLVSSALYVGKVRSRANRLRRVRHAHCVNVDNGRDTHLLKNTKVTFLSEPVNAFFIQSDSM